jgi:hypothetical protein
MRERYATVVPPAAARHDPEIAHFLNTNPGHRTTHDRAGHGMNREIIPLLAGE